MNLSSENITVKFLPNEYELLIRPIEQKMIRSAWRITQNADDAEDAFQEALTQILKTISRIRQHANPHALILRICTHVAIDLVRRKLRIVQQEQSTDVASLVDVEADVNVALLNSEDQERVQAAIAQLPEQQSIAVTMRYLLEASYSEIASGLDCAEATARVHVARGIKRLKQVLSTPSSPSSRTHHE